MVILLLEIFNFIFVKKCGELVFVGYLIFLGDLSVWRSGLLDIVYILVFFNGLVLYYFFGLEFEMVIII